MNVYFAREPMTMDLWDEALPLLHQHWVEIAHYTDIPLEPDIEKYMAMAKAGTLRVYTARDRDDEELLVGYALFFVANNAHYKSSVQAVQDVIYVDTHARGLTGARFIKYCDMRLALEGIQVVYHHVKAAHNFGKMLERMDYKLVDLIYAKRLD
jgi:hypothetical protein